jgi:hypothetical protein
MRKRFMTKNLTIVAVDTAYHELTKQALDAAVKITKSSNVLLLSDKNFFPGSKFVQIDNISQKEYNRIVLKELNNYVDTDHYMIVQYDGMPTDESNWEDDYLKYDYIGAPWNWLPRNKNVGNGGFSIRSKKLAEICARPDVVFEPNDPSFNSIAEDDHICHYYKNYLESNGIAFAPTDLALKFSAENPGGKFPTYGFHGTLCLPYYLTDDQLEFYISNMQPQQFNSAMQIRIIFGLYMAQRYDHLELMMDAGIKVNPNFKNVVLNQLLNDLHFFPGLTVGHIEDLLINY